MSKSSINNVIKSSASDTIFQSNTNINKNSKNPNSSCTLMEQNCVDSKSINASKTDEDRIEKLTKENNKNYKTFNSYLKGIHNNTLLLKELLPCKSEDSLNKILIKNSDIKNQLTRLENKFSREWLLRR